MYHNLSFNVLNAVGGYESLRDKDILELEEIANEYSLPKEVLTNNWRIHMLNATRSNQKLAYPGFNTL